MDKTAHIDEIVAVDGTTPLVWRGAVEKKDCAVAAILLGFKSKNPEIV